MSDDYGSPAIVRGVTLEFPEEVAEKLASVFSLSAHLGQEDVLSIAFAEEIPEWLQMIRAKWNESGTDGVDDLNKEEEDEDDDDELGETSEGGALGVEKE